MEQRKLKDIERVLMPDGRVFTYYRGEGQSWSEIVLNRILPDWEQYCDEHWISVNHEDIFAPEKRVKAFLDRCGWLMILDHPEGIESKYKAMVHTAVEIPATECAPEVSDYFYSDRKPPLEEECEKIDTYRSELHEKVRKKPALKTKQTKFKRIEKIIKEHPFCERSWRMVNADNEFSFGGCSYRIAQYEGYETGQMDRVFVVKISDDQIRCYDQSVYPIPDEDVHMLAS